MHSVAQVSSQFNQLYDCIMSAKPTDMLKIDNEETIHFDVAEWTIFDEIV